MDEKARYIEKYRKLGYEIADDNGLIIFYVDNYSKERISDIRKIIDESKYNCSWGIRPIREAVINKTDDKNENGTKEKISASAEIKTFTQEIDPLKDDLEEELAKIRDIPESIKESEIEAEKADKAEEYVSFTQESLFDMF